MQQSPNKHDPFHPDNLKLQGDDAAVVNFSAWKEKATKKARREPIEKWYALCPLLHSAKALAVIGNKRATVWLYLLHRHRLRDGPIVLQQKALKTLGVSRHTVYRTLKAWEKAGLISIVSRRGKLITVTMLGEIYR
jgi:hypothetical protein